MAAAGAQRRRSSASSSSASPEFRFWPVDADPAASPSCADEIFSGGLILPRLPLPVPRRAFDGDAAPACPEPSAAAAGGDFGMLCDDDDDASGGCC
uniref:Uncharacterized protein n=1 Tax=Oryza brachyantha TaxID=4533 RepID=J3N8J0_ORYBR